MNKENLLRMADYIEKVPQEKFDMDAFRIGTYRTPECNSIGCVIGHCTVLDAKNVMKNFVREDGTIRFWEWSLDFTGINNDMDEWNFLFGSDWNRTDTTQTGAAKRIRYFVEKGLPDNWLDVMDGKYPIPY